MNPCVNPQFRVSQVAGSLRMEGIAVTGSDEQLMHAILTGQTDAQEEKRRLIERLKQQNAVKSD